MENELEGEVPARSRDSGAHCWNIEEVFEVVVGQDKKARLLRSTTTSRWG